MLTRCKASYRENILLLQFNKEMNLLGPHSALNNLNYTIEINDLLNPLPDNTFIETENRKDIRIILPTDFSHYLNPSNCIHIGYITRKELKYVESYDGQVYNLCDDINLGNEIPQVILTDGYGYIENNNSIVYKYTGPNIIYETYSEDFYATVDGVVKRPYKITQLSHDEFLFQFETDAFINKTNVYLGVYSDPRTRDIYGFPIKGGVSLKIKPTSKSSLKTLSLSTVDATLSPTIKRAYLMIKFDDRIKEFHPEDFGVSYKGKDYNVSFTGTIIQNETAFYVYVDLESNVKYPLSPIIFSTKVPPDDIKTINYADIPINPVYQVIAANFKSNKLEWEVSTSDDLKNNIIDIYFDDVMDWSTIITNSQFNNIDSPWDGSEISIPSGAIKFAKGSPSDVMTLDFNPSFGYITIVSDQNNLRKFINGNISNNRPAKLKAEGNKLSITFAADEDIQAYPMSIETCKYTGTTFIMSKTDYFLCYIYEPQGISSSDLIIVPPMNSSNDNPFNGGILKANYIINVDSSHPYRIYGFQNLTTTTNGYINVQGTLNSSDMLTLYNLTVLGSLIVDGENVNLYLNIKDGQFNCDAIQAQKVLKK